MRITIPNRFSHDPCWDGDAENIADAVKKAIASRADLRGADLSDADLRGAVLRGADLSDAVLSRADLSGADLSDAVLRGAVLRGADLSDAVLRGAVLRGAVLRDAVLRCAVLRGADLSDADLSGADLSGADLGEKKIKCLRVFSGLYRYQIWAGVWEDGTAFVRMGCQFRTVAEWDEIGGIRELRTSEFPNDGSARSEQRARAFEFARNEALEMAKLP